MFKYQYYFWLRRKYRRISTDSAIIITELLFFRYNYGRMKSKTVRFRSLLVVSSRTTSRF